MITGASQAADWLAVYQIALPGLTRNALDAAGIEAVDHAKSYPGPTKPGVHATQQVEFTTGAGEAVSFTAYAGRGEGPRSVHPGGWADDTTNLMSSYGHTANVEGALAILEITNTMWYAWHLERLGYWVVSGLFEGFVQDRVQHWMNLIFLTYFR